MVAVSDAILCSRDSVVLDICTKLSSALSLEVFRTLFKLDHLRATAPSRVSTR